MQARERWAKCHTVESAAVALSRLTSGERLALEQAANCPLGDQPVEDPVLEVAIEEGLVYKSTGRIRPMVMLLLQRRGR